MQPDAAAPPSPMKPGTQILEQAPSVALPEAKQEPQEDAPMPDAPSVPSMSPC